MTSRSQGRAGLVLAAALLLAASGARAQGNCMPRDEAVAWLETQFGERVIGRGLADEGRVMFEVFAGPEGSWTLLVSTPEGGSCVIVDGLDWQHLPPPWEDAVAAGLERPPPQTRGH